MLIWIIVLAVIIGLVPAYIAKGKGRSFIRWWIYGAFVFIAALPHSLMLSSEGGSLYGTKRCGYCRQSVNVNATHCKHCGYDFTTMGY